MLKTSMLKECHFGSIQDRISDYFNSFIESESKFQHQSKEVFY